jgi:hypothetical protein
MRARALVSFTLVISLALARSVVRNFTDDFLDDACVHSQENAAPTGVLNAFGAKASQAMAGATTRWGRTSARTSHGKPRSGSQSQMGGSMTTAGADVDMRESYSSYLERSASEDMTDALPDIDLYDHDNPLCVTQYVNDIYQYWYKVEVRENYFR